jgi:hypothetical protein
MPSDLGWVCVRCCPDRQTSGHPRRFALQALLTAGDLTVSGIEHMEKNPSRILPERLSSFVGADQAGSLVHARQQAEPAR